jgi:hypothetical protein
MAREEVYRGFHVTWKNTGEHLIAGCRHADHPEGGFVILVPFSDGMDSLKMKVDARMDVELAKMACDSPHANTDSGSKA